MFSSMAGVKAGSSRVLQVRLWECIDSVSWTAWQSCHLAD